MISKQFLLKIGCALLVGITVIAIQSWDPLQRLKLLCFDTAIRIRNAPIATPCTVLITIDDADIEQIGSWPWDRSWFAKAVKALQSLGAAAIYLDFPLPYDSEENEEETLGDSAFHADSVYVPQSAVRHSGNDQFPTHQKLFQEVKASGPNVLFPDRDGVVRTLPIFVTGPDESPQLHIILKIILDYLNMRVLNITGTTVSIGNDQTVLKLPTNHAETIPINWMGQWPHNFTRIPFSDLLQASYSRQNGTLSNPALATVRGRICVIGLVAAEYAQTLPTPLEPAAPRIRPLLTAMESIVAKKPLKPVSAAAHGILILLCALMPAVLFPGRQGFREVAPLLFCLLLAAGSCLLLMANIYLDVFFPMLALLLSRGVMRPFYLTRMGSQRRTFIKLAVTDGLTGLYNNRYFRALIAQEYQAAQQDPLQTFSILMLDIDHFKQVNDTHGHQIGDLILAQMAKVLRISVRTSDIVARYGGEEMIVLLRGTSFVEDAMDIAEQMRKNIENHLVREKGQVYQITVSIGVSTLHAKEDIDSVIKRADDALYQAKQNGRNRVCTLETYYQRTNGNG